jgi:hypothetical protein
MSVVLLIGVFAVAGMFFVFTIFGSSSNGGY